MRTHWEPHERLDLHAWIHKQADEACGERIRTRIEYLRWLHRAVAWEHIKEALKNVAAAVIVLTVPGLGLIMGGQWLYRKWRNK